MGDSVTSASITAPSLLREDLERSVSGGFLAQIGSAGVLRGRWDIWQRATFWVQS